MSHDCVAACQNKLKFQKLVNNSEALFVCEKATQFAVLWICEIQEK